MKVFGLRNGLFIAALVLAGDVSAAGDVVDANKAALPGKSKQVVYNSQAGLVVQIVSYQEYGGGDVTFTLDKATPSCAGYWLRASDPGFKANLSLLLMARSGRVPLIAYGSDDRIWPGSSAVYCHLYALQIQ